MFLLYGHPNLPDNQPLEVVGQLPEKTIFNSADNDKVDMAENYNVLMPAEISDHVVHWPTSTQCPLELWTYSNLFQPCVTTIEIIIVY